MATNQNDKCSCCGSGAQPTPPIDPRIFDPLNPLFNPGYGLTLPQVPTINNSARDAVNSILQSRVDIDPDPYPNTDPYYDAYIEPFDPSPEMPPLEEMFDKLAEDLPLPTDLKAEFIANKDNIIQKVYDDATNGGGGGGGGASAAAKSFTLYSLLNLYATILFFIPSFSLFISINIFLPFANLIAAAIAAIQIWTLFNQTIVGIKVLVQLGLKPIIQLLANLIPLCFSAAFSVVLSLPSFSIVFGLNITLGFAAVLAAISISFFVSLNLSFTISPNFSAEVGGGAAPPPAGSSAIPGCPEGIQLMQEKPGALVDMKPFGSSHQASPLSEIASRPIDTETKINIASPTGRSTIRNSVISQVTLGKTPISSLREALNKCKIEERAAVYLFNYLNLPLTFKITLSELLLSAAGFNKETPIDPAVLSLMAVNLPNVIKLNVGYVFSVMGGVEPPCPVVTLSA